MKMFARLLLLCLAFSSLAAQKHSPLPKLAATPDKLLSLKVSGTSRYSDKQILDASGLQIGQNATDADFKEAVRRLGDSGLFGDIAYSFTSSGSGVKVEIKLTDVDQAKLVPAEFDNFVWLTDQELHTELKSRVPLFQDLLPIAGNLPDRVSEALQSILLDRHLAGRVDYLREGDQSGGALHGIVYRLEEIDIRIEGFDFPGASEDQVILLKAAAHRELGAAYGRSSLAAVAKFDLLPVYLQRGYLKAAFAPSEARVASKPATRSSDSSEDSPGPAEIRVVAIIPTTPGKVYSSSGVDWKGNSALSTKEISALLHLTDAQPVDAVRLASDLENVKKLYHSRGYMTAQIKATPEFSDENASVHYDIRLAEGDLYKMGDLEILGLDTQATARIKGTWTLREGEPYNADYFQKFLADSSQLLPRGVRWAIEHHETLDSKDKTVDVEIRYKQQ